MVRALRANGHADEVLKIAIEASVLQLGVGVEAHLADELAHVAEGRVSGIAQPVEPLLHGVGDCRGRGAVAIGEERVLRPVDITLG